MRSRPRFVIAQHQDDMPPGRLGDWAVGAGLRADIVRPDLGAALPAAADVDLIALLGADAPAILGRRTWTDREAQWLGEAALAGVPVLGIGYGAQLLSVVLGGSRWRSHTPEVGWIEVRTEDPDQIPPGPWFAWHADGVEPPVDADVVARNRSGAQAFTFGPHLGVLFHPEATPETIGRWAEPGGRELSRAGLARRTLARQSADRAEASAEAAGRLFDGFLARAAVYAPARRFTWLPGGTVA